MIYRHLSMVNILPLTRHAYARTSRTHTMRVEAFSSEFSLGSVILKRLDDLLNSFPIKTSHHCWIYRRYSHRVCHSGTGIVFRFQTYQFPSLSSFSLPERLLPLQVSKALSTAAPPYLFDVSLNPMVPRNAPPDRAIAFLWHELFYIASFMDSQLLQTRLEMRKMTVSERTAFVRRADSTRWIRHDAWCITELFCGIDLTGFPEKQNSPFHGSVAKRQLISWKSVEPNWLDDEGIRQRWLHTPSYLSPFSSLCQFSCQVPVNNTPINYRRECHLEYPLDRSLWSLSHPYCE